MVLLRQGAALCEPAAEPLQTFDPKWLPPSPWCQRAAMVLLRQDAVLCETVGGPLRTFDPRLLPLKHWAESVLEQHADAPLLTWQPISWLQTTVAASPH